MEADQARSMHAASGLPRLIKDCSVRWARQRATEKDHSKILKDEVTECKVRLAQVEESLRLAISKGEAARTTVAENRVSALADELGVVTAVCGVIKRRRP